MLQKFDAKHNSGLVIPLNLETNFVALCQEVSDMPIVCRQLHDAIIWLKHYHTVPEFQFYVAIIFPWEI